MKFVRIPLTTDGVMVRFGPRSGGNRPLGQVSELAVTSGGVVLSAEQGNVGRGVGVTVIIPIPNLAHVFLAVLTNPAMLLQVVREALKIINLGLRSRASAGHDPS